MLRLAPLFHDTSEHVRHETRTELTVIRGYAQFAHRCLRRPSGPALEDVERALLAIEQASRRLEASLEQTAHEYDWRGRGGGMGPAFTISLRRLERGGNGGWA